MAGISHVGGGAAASGAFRKALPHFCEIGFSGPI
jgi:hypothetical protein